MDEDIFKYTWNGAIPVQFNLSQDSYDGKCEPLYMMVSRILYLPMYKEQIYTSFKSYISEDMLKDFWLEYGGNPIKWHLPVGVIVDSLQVETHLPWKIVVHYRKFPHEQIIAFTDESLKGHYISSVKESDCLQHEMGVLNNFTSFMFDTMYESLKNLNEAEFLKLFRKLYEQPPQQLAFKLLRKNLKPLQFRYKIKDVSDSLADLIDMCKQYLNESGKAVLDETKVKTHGVVLNRHDSLTLLANSLSYPDGFLHLSAVTSGD